MKKRQWSRSRVSTSSILTPTTGGIATTSILSNGVHLRFQDLTSRPLLQEGTNENSHVLPGLDST